jgi:pimeloyl-ACP methyl ester carboxylesterase
MRLAFTFACSLVAAAVLAQQPAPPPKLDPTVFDAYLGTYEFPSGRLLVIARTERRLYAYEPGSERLRGLERVDDRTWVAGPSLLKFAPESYRLVFQKDVSAIRYTAAGEAPVRAKKLRLYREEAVTFRSGDVTLAGTLFLPATKGPYPAIVLGHGSGAQDRNGYLANIRFMADHLARHGIAVLTYDKRGSGRSSGDWATASFADLASDMVAGIRMLRTRPDIIAAQVGAGGSSQAGWVTAKAVTQLPDIAFVVLTGAGGSGYTVEEQNLYNTEIEMRAAKVSEDRIARALDLQRRFFQVLRRGEGADAREYDEAVRVARQDAVLRDWIFPLSSEVEWRSRNAWYMALEVSFDPLPAWRAYKGPVLGIFGELDAQTPVAQVVPRFTEALMSRKGADFTVTVFPAASHLLLEATRPSDDELETLQRVVPGFYDTVSDWLWVRLRRLESRVHLRHAWKPNRKSATVSTSSAKRPPTTPAASWPTSASRW